MGKFSLRLLGVCAFSILGVGPLGVWLISDAQASHSQSRDALCENQSARQPTPSLRLLSSLSRFVTPDGVTERIAYCSTPVPKGDRYGDRYIVACHRREDFLKSREYNALGFLLEIDSKARVLKSFAYPGISFESFPQVTPAGRVLLQVTHPDEYETAQLTLDENLNLIRKVDFGRIASAPPTRLDTGEWIYLTDESLRAGQKNLLTVLDAEGNLLQQIEVESDRPEMPFFSQEGGKRALYLVGKNSKLTIVDVDLWTDQTVQLTDEAGFVPKYLSGITRLADGRWITLSDRGDLFEVDPANARLKQMYSSSQFSGEQKKYSQKPIAFSDGTLAIISEFSDTTVHVHLLSSEGPLKSSLKKIFRFWAYGPITAKLSLIKKGGASEALFIGLSGNLFFLKSDGTLLAAQNTPGAENLILPYELPDGDLWMGAYGGLKRMSFDGPLLKPSSEVYQVLERCESAGDTRSVSGGDFN